MEEKNQPVSPVGTSKSSKNIIKGILWLVVPIISMFCILNFYALISFIAEAKGLSGVGVNMINVILGLFGILALVMIITGIPIAIIYFTKKD